MFVTHHTGIWDRPLLEKLWTLYRIAYEPMAEAAVTRETLMRIEFEEVLRDPSFRSWLVWDGEKPVAMCVVATDLTHSRYLSAAFFEARYPAHVRNGTVHYIYWLVVHPDYAARGTLIRLARESLAVEADEGALVVFDTPQTNERSEHGGFARMMERLAQMVGAPAPVELLEVQRYYAIDLSEPRPADVPLHDGELELAAVS